MNQSPLSLNSNRSCNTQGFVEHEHAHSDVGNDLLDLSMQSVGVEIDEPMVQHLRMSVRSVEPLLRAEESNLNNSIAVASSSLLPSSSYVAIPQQSLERAGNCSHSRKNLH